MDSPISIDLSGLARQLSVPAESIGAVVKLLVAGNTVPFLNRYRRDEIGGLTEVQVAQIKSRVDRQQVLEERKDVILRAIATRGSLTDELAAQIQATHSPKVLEDLYLPYKVKKQSTRDAEQLQSLTPLADAILSAEESKSIEELAAPFVDAEIGFVVAVDAITAVRELIEERFNHNIELRKSLRRIFRRTGVLISKRAHDLDNVLDSPTTGDTLSNNIPSCGATSAIVTSVGRTSVAERMPEDASPAVLDDTAVPDDTAALEDAIDAVAQANNTEVDSPSLAATAVTADRSPSGESTAVDVPSADESESKSESEGNRETDGVKSDGTGATQTESPQASKRTSRVTSTGITLSKEARRQLRRDARHRKRQKLESSFTDYFDFHESVSKLREQRVLAIDRGERFRVLDVHLTVDNDAVKKEADAILVPTDHPRVEFLRSCVESALQRLIIPSLERDLRRDLTDRAEAHAIRAFSGNLRKLLQARPVRQRVLAIVPDYRNGCKIAALDETGQVLEHKQLYLLGGDDRKATGQKEVLEMIRRHDVTVIAIGSGKGSRESEQLVGGWIQGDLAGRGVSYAIVNESGVNRYATSVLAVEELPAHTPAAREAISIGRRLLDPLAEFVKIEPGAIDVGTYPEEMKAKPIQESLGSVVFECVNSVGVNVNTASTALLKNVAGLNQLTAQHIFEHRCKNGPFRSREQIQNVDGLGADAFTQAIGFLKVHGGDHPLDATAIHPDHYATAETLLNKIGATLSDMRDYFGSTQTAEPQTWPFADKLAQLNVEELATELGVGKFLAASLIAELSKPGLDPRFENRGPALRQGSVTLESLMPGMAITGTIVNVVEFGVFVDIGLKESGLVHISRMADHFVRDPSELFSTGQSLPVWVVEVDKAKRRVALTAIEPGKEKPPEVRTRGKSRPNGPSLGKPPRGPKGRQESVRTYKPKPKPHRAAKPVAPITKKMIEGSEPMRTFSDLLQFADQKRKVSGKDSKSDGETSS